MKRLFINKSDFQTNTITFSGDNYHYLKNVVRVKVGTRVEAIETSSGISYQTTIRDIHKNVILASIDHTVVSNPVPPLQISIIQGLPKAQKMELIIQKCTELGANAFYPLSTQRIITDIQDKQNKKIQRWQSVAMEAARQSRHNRIPTVHPLTTIDELKNIYAAHQLNLILWEEATDTNLKQILTTANYTAISITIGPEGGLTLDEVKQMQHAGGRIISLGDGILRTETAPIAITSMLIYEYLLNK